MKITEGYIPYLGYRTYFRAVGETSHDKPPLLLLHGGPGSTHNYFEVLDRLAQEDERQIISYDQLGCGNSYLDGHPELWTMETWIGELKEVRKALSLDEVILLGQSFGGILALEYVCRYETKGVRGLVLSSTLPSSALWAQEQARLIRLLPEDMQGAIARALRTGDYTDPSYVAAVDEYMLRHASGVFGAGDPECLTRPKRVGKESYLYGWGPNEFTSTGTLRDFDVTALLPQITIPTLIFSGGNDLCTPYIAKTMADRIPNAQWTLFRESRHMCYVEENDAYCALLREWMNRL